MSEKSKRLLVEAWRRIENSKDLNEESLRKIEKTEARIRKSLTDNTKSRK